MVVAADGAGRGAGAPTPSTARTAHAFDNSDSAAIKLAGRISDHASGNASPIIFYARYVFKRTGEIRFDEVMLRRADASPAGVPLLLPCEGAVAT